MSYIKGSEWRKWDLHVHTPYSLVHHYGANTDATWEKFISDLEALPAEFSVIGINDYIFVDGYERVLAEKQKGRLGNIDLFLPVVELRLDKFGGTKQLTRVNYHVIFSNDLSPDVIRSQFLSGLCSKYQLSPLCQDRGIKWEGVPTIQSLTDFGRSIIESVPERERGNFDSPLKEGFNNLNVSLHEVQKLLSGFYFEGKTITAIGKTEWEAIKWNDHSIADKRNIINGTDLVFVAAETPEAHFVARAKLTESKVNDRLLDCSDAHSFSTSTDKDRIGNCFTWIKADPTFVGLKQVIHEPTERIFIGDTPPQLRSVIARPTKFARELSITKSADSSLEEAWFDGVRIPFNPGLVAVIGNKGNGKSALVDILGLVGNSRQHADASFLNNRRFNQPKQKKGEHFEAVLEWQSGHTQTRRLNIGVEPASVERVKYIPQNFFEKICNEIAAGDSSAFDAEIKDVIFSHVPLDARIGKASLTELIDYRTSEVERSLISLRGDVAGINRRLIELQTRASDAYRDALERQREAKSAELKAHDERRPPQVPEPSETGDVSANKLTGSVTASRKELGDLDEEISQVRAEQQNVARLVSITERAFQKYENLHTQARNLIDALDQDLATLGLALDKVVRFEVDDAPMRNKAEELRVRKEKVDAQLSDQGEESLLLRREALLNRIETLRAQLDAPGKQYQEYLKELRTWEEARAHIVGAKEVAGSLAHVEDQIDRWSDLPEEIRELVDERAALVRMIYGNLLRMKAVYEELYQPVQDFIAGHAIAKEQFRLDFDVSISDVKFSDRFLTFINHSISGSFCGKEQGEGRLTGLLERHDFDSDDGVLLFVEDVEKCLAKDLRKEPFQKTPLESQLKKGMTLEGLYNFLYGLDYLMPRYGLQMAGKPLDQLSPGEKGSLLLVFYLLVDQNDTPLIIDQPEENLDNQTIVSMLVPSIKMAKTRRQIFIVTHNPNIAVVCDAEQVIYALHEPGEQNRITYVSGAIENPAINQKIMDVLEGTKPAFDNRSVKYL